MHASNRRRRRLCLVMGVVNLPWPIFLGAQTPGRGQRWGPRRRLVGATNRGYFAQYARSRLGAKSGLTRTRRASCCVKLGSDWVEMGASWASNGICMSLLSVKISSQDWGRRGGARLSFGSSLAHLPSTRAPAFEATTTWLRLLHLPSHFLTYTTSHSPPPTTCPPLSRPARTREQCAIPNSHQNSRRRSI